MRIGIHGNANGGMAQHGRNDFSRDMTFEHQCCMGMPQIVKTNYRKATVDQYGLELMLKSVGRKWSVIEAAANKI